MQSIQNLKVIIVGAGEVGMNVAMKLGKHDEIEITLIEADESRSALMQASLDCNHVQGSGLDPENLKLAGIYECDLFYALTDADEVNLLACHLAKEMVSRFISERLNEHDDELGDHLDDSLSDEVLSPCPPLGEQGRQKYLEAYSASERLYLYARVRSESLYEHVQMLFPSINAIFPERTCSRKLDELFHYQQVFDVVELESNRLKLYGLKIHPNSQVVGQSLKDFTSDHQLTIAAIARKSENTRFQARVLQIPWAEYEMQAHDEIYLATTPKTLHLIHDIFASQDESDRLSSIAIAGETSVALNVFFRLVSRSNRRLENEGNEVNAEGTRKAISLITSDEKVAEKVEQSDFRGQATVVSGSLTDIAKLAELGVGPKSTLLISGSDEDNLICALLARELGCERILIVNNREQYAELIDHLGFDGIFSPRQLAVNEMVHQSLKHLSKSAFDIASSEDIEVRSFVVDPGSALCGLALKDLTTVGFPRKFAVIAALKDPDDELHRMPTGQDILHAGSVAYIVAKSADFHNINSIFGRRRSRFRLWRS